MEALIEQTEEENPDADPEFIFAEAEKDVFNQALPGVIGRRNWVSCALRALLVLEAAGALNGDFSSSYVDAMDGGIFICQDSTLVDRVRRMDGKVLSHFLRRAVEVYQHGEENLNLGPSIEAEHGALTETLATLQEDLTLLQESAAKQGTTLRSKYAGQNKIMRTTVIAKRVQLTKDSAALSEDDKKLTDIVDQVTTVLVDGLSAPPPQEVLFSEAWIYDSKSPSRDVFVPRPRVVFERGLSRPHDYLGCEAEGQDGSAATAATLPATAILYRLYLETGNLINVADLWAAFHGIVSQDESDERKVLVQFYQAMAELRALGFVKASKKKADHIAKLKWL
jgi:origin recognition complex subunit 3